MSDVAVVAAYVLENYPISGPVEAEYVGLGANHNYIVAAPQNRYVLKIYCENGYYPRNDEVYTYEVELLAHLASLNLPVVTPVVRRDGELLGTAPFSDSPGFCALFHFSRGREHGAWSPCVNEEAVRALGAAIAGIHAGSDRFSRLNPRHHFDERYLIDGPLEHLERLLVQRKGESLSFFQGHADRMRDQLRALGKASPQYGLIHSDLHVGNILYDDVDGLCIIDFDQCASGWRAYDVATFKLTIERNASDLADEIWPLFLEGYEKVRPLNKQEHACLSTFADAWLLWDIGETLAMSTLWGGHRPDLVDEGMSQDAYLGEALSVLRRIAAS